jgi:2',3'-cyclic-nucleotide 2'-phosphodiesterase (5'-nucleotidase family)
MLHALVLLVPLFVRLASTSQPSAPEPIAAPIRNLTFGQINFLHTTDTHGWHAGHLLEPSYAADWGDYISFATRLREKLEADGKDLLVIDTGDRIEGNGLFDASHPRGAFTYDIFSQQPMDLICSGNHELYKKSSARGEQSHLVPAYAENYLASNLDIVDEETGGFVPLAAKWRKITTKKQGIRIMSFGFLYDFTRNANNTRIQPVEDAIKETWFQDAIRDNEIDLFVVIGHSAVRSAEFDAIHKEIRSVRWSVPIQFFGGHYHIRDYKKYDSNAYGLASGRFMETVGFQSIDGIKSGGAVEPQKSSSFFRRYIDNNLFSFHHHTSLNSTTFPTKKGRKVSKMITDARRSLQLDHVYGCAPQDLWMSRAPYPNESSIYTWLEKEVLPEAVNDTSRADQPRIILLNTGAIRFDIFKGPFSKDSTYIISPFTSAFRYIADVPYGKAKQLIKILNSAGQIFTQATNHELDLRDLAPDEQRGRESSVVADDVPAEHNTRPYELERGLQYPLLTDTKSELHPGYTTRDDAGTDGDDTEHSSISFYRVPNVIQSLVVPSQSQSGSSLPSDGYDLRDDDVVDVVFNEFIQPYLLLALRFTGQIYEDDDTKGYMEGRSFTELLAGWIEHNWTKDC